MALVQSQGSEVSRIVSLNKIDEERLTRVILIKEKGVESPIERK